jgi:hypothetical protein
MVIKRLGTISSASVRCYSERVLSFRQLSDSNVRKWRKGNWLVVSVDRRRGCFIVHCRNIKLLGFNVCYRQQQQWQWLGLRPYRHVRTDTTTCHYCDVSHFCRMDSSIKVLLEFMSLTVARQTSPTAPHFSQNFSGDERTVHQLLIEPTSTVQCCDFRLTFKRKSCILCFDGHTFVLCVCLHSDCLKELIDFYATGVLVFPQSHIFLSMWTWIIPSWRSYAVLRCKWQQTCQNVWSRKRAWCFIRK